MDAHNVAHDASRPQLLGDYLGEKIGPAPNGGLVEHEAIAFLKWLDPSGRHNLVAIDPEGQQTPQGRTFAPGGWPEMAGWIAAREGRLNIYYSLNAPTPDAPDKKLCDRNIAAIRCICADLDPAPGKPLDAERARLKSLASAQGGRPAVVDSGGGYQLVWRLAEKLDPTEHAVAVRSQGRGIAKALGGDAVFDLARIMRLPGTTNLPTAKKLALGRKPSMATCITVGGSCALPELATLYPPAAVAEQLDADDEIARAQASLDMVAIQSVTCLADLDDVAKARIEEMIAQEGRFSRLWSGDPSVLGPDKSGSGYRAAMAAELGRSGGFSAQQFGEILHAWPHAVLDGQDVIEVLTARTIARDWVRCGLNESPEQWFKPIAEPSGTLWDAAQPMAGESTSATPGATFPTVVSIEGMPDPISIPPREWLVWPWCPANTVSAIVGAPGVSKSAFALRLAVSIVSEVEAVLRGHNGLGEERISRSGPVLVYNREDDVDEMRRRVAGLGIANDLGAFPHGLHLVSGVEGRRLVLLERNERGGPIRRAAGFEGLRSQIRELRPVLVILDPLVSLSAGLDENSNDDMEALLAELRLLASSERVTIIVVHHAGKNADKMSGELGASRGASAIVGAVRGGITLTAIRAHEVQTDGLLKGLPPGRYVVGEGMKANYGPKADPIVYRLREIAVGNGDAGNGDTVVVHEIVDRRGASAEAERAERVRAEDQATTAALILHDVLGAREQAALSTERDVLATRFRDANLIRGNSRKAVDDKLSDLIFGKPTDILVDGQTVRISVEQDGNGRTAPRIIKRQKIAEQDSDESLRDLFE